MEYLLLVFLLYIVVHNPFEKKEDSKPDVEFKKEVKYYIKKGKEYFKVEE